jgi:hypothetical protein
MRWGVEDAALSPRDFFNGLLGPLKKSREAQSCGFGVPLASRTAGESTDSSRIRDADGASKTLL